MTRRPNTATPASKTDLNDQIRRPEELGTPRVILGIGYVLVVIETCPDSVIVNVTTDGGGKIVGNAELFSNTVFGPKRGLYVLFASPEETIPPTTAVTEALNV